MENGLLVLAVIHPSPPAPFYVFHKPSIALITFSTYLQISASSKISSGTHSLLLAPDCTYRHELPIRFINASNSYSGDSTEFGAVEYHIFLIGYAVLIIRGNVSVN
jgi:hypothetical protein